MSLEKALEANTAAVLALTAELSRFVVGNVASTTLAETQQVSRLLDPSFSPIRDAAKGLAKKQDVEASAPSKATPAPAAVTPASTEAAPVAATSTLKYQDVKDKMLALVKRDLKSAQELLADLGVKSLQVYEQKPEQWPMLIARLTAIEVA